MFVNILLAWTASLTFGLNATQNYYNSHWQGKETGSITWVGFMKGEFDQNFNPKIEFKNSFNFEFGQTYSQNPENKKWNPPLKSTDKIDNESVLRFKMGWLLDPFSSLRLESCFFDEKNGLYLNPVELTESFGFAKTLVKSPESEINSRLGLAVKEKLTRAQGEKNDKEGGVQFILNISHAFHKFAKYEGELRIFKAFLHSKSESPETWKTVDMDFENNLNFGLSKILNLLITWEFIYDKDAIDALQIKENVALGLIFKIF